MENNLKKHLFNLPDGATLKFAPPYWPKPISSWFMSHDDQRVWKASSLEKRKQYRLNLWSSSTNLYVLAADFDSLPYGYSDYDALAERLQKLFSPIEAVITRSASNKVKAFFLVATPNDIEMDRAIATETLNKIFMFDVDLFYSLDLSTTALRITYLNQDVLNGLSSNLYKLKPISCALPVDFEDSKVINTSTTGTGMPKPYRSYMGEISPLLKKIKLNSIQERVLRILLEAKQLITPYGFCISTSKISKDLDVSQQLISRYRRGLEKEGWLKILGPRFYVPGKRALRFVADGDLATVMSEMYTVKLIIPETIADGAWQTTLLRLMSFLQKFHTLAEALAIVSQIRGSKEKGRLKKAEGLYKWYAKIRKVDGAAKSSIKSNIDTPNGDISPNFQRNQDTLGVGSPSTSSDKSIRTVNGGGR